MRHGIEYLVVWDKPGTRAAPGRFYQELRELGDEVRFIQRSVHGMKTIESAKRLAELARRYRLEVAVFRALEICALAQ